MCLAREKELSHFHLKSHMYEGGMRKVASLKRTRS